MFPALLQQQVSRHHGVGEAGLPVSSVATATGDRDGEREWLPQTDGIPRRCRLHALGHFHVRSFDQQAFERLRLGGGKLGGGPQQIRPASKRSAEQT